MCYTCELRKSEEELEYIACPSGEFYKAKTHRQMAKAQYTHDYLKVRDEYRVLKGGKAFSKALNRMMYLHICQDNGIDRRVAYAIYAYNNKPKAVIGGVIIIDIDPLDVISLSYPA